MRTSFLALGALIATATAAPSTPHVQHEKRNVLPPGWEKHQRISSHEVIPMQFGLQQSNLHKADEYLMDVSHPDSPNYGKHWSAKQIAETFAPSQESVNTVKSWLRESGITSERIKVSQSLGWLAVNATIIEAENLLKTKYYLHKHTLTGKPHVACSEYSVPAYVQPHIDFITPTVHFDTKLAQGEVLEERDIEYENLEERAEPSSTSPAGAASSTAAVGRPVQSKAAVKVITEPINGFSPKKGASLNIHRIAMELPNCNAFITPDCLRALYRFPTNFFANPRNSFGITEYTPNAYLQGDLDLFFANFSQRQVQKTPTPAFIDGGINQQGSQSFNLNGESDLDLEYAMTLVNPQPVTLYQVGDIYTGASFNNFLDAIDGSYCNFEGGDDKFLDSIYPSNITGGYTGPQNCGGFSATKVISTSYGYNEADLTAAYERRQCNEYMKLGLAGTSFLFSSGDNGVAGNNAQCLTQNGTYNGGGQGRFNPAFPSTCPYITSVGATQIKPGASITEAEKACETVVYSGGGFSNVFDIPSYQTGAVKSWFATNTNGYTSQQFNNTQKTRGYPDISANGANYVVAVNSAFTLTFGTSASTPIVGSILTLINQARLSIGKSSIGFVNPALYANPWMLNDITEGSNPGCGTQGFTAIKGWDPVTGLGTPNFPRMVGKFLSLP